MTPSLRRTPVPGVWGTEAMGRTLRTLRWSSSMRRARPVATDRRHTFGVAATGRAMLSNQNNSVSVCNRVTMPLTSPGVESEARAMTKRKRRLDSGMVVLKLDSWTSLGEQGTEHSHSAAAKRCSFHPPLAEKRLPLRFLDTALRRAYRYRSVDATYRSDLRELNELNFARFDAKVEQRWAQLDAKLEQRLAQVDAKLAQADAKLEQR